MNYEHLIFQLISKYISIYSKSIFNILQFKITIKLHIQSKYTIKTAAKIKRSAVSSFLKLFFI